MLYRATRDGWNVKDFHGRCDGNGPSVTLIKVKETNKICGGFTSLPWSSTGGVKADKDAVVFSVSNEQVFPVDKNRSVTHFSSQGPSFGYGYELDIGNFSMMNKEGDARSSTKTTADCSVLVDLADGTSPLTGVKSDRFTLAELEVFQIVY